MPAQTQLPRWGVKWRVWWECGATFHRMNGSNLWPQTAPPGYCNLLVVFWGEAGGRVVYSAYSPNAPKLWFVFQNTIWLQVPTRYKHPVWISVSANNFREWLIFFQLISNWFSLAKACRRLISLFPELLRTQKSESNKNPPVAKQEINDYEEHIVKVA